MQVEAAGKIVGGGFETSDQQGGLCTPLVACFARAGHFFIEGAEADDGAFVAERGDAADVGSTFSLLRPARPLPIQPSKILALSLFRSCDVTQRATLSPPRAGYFAV